MGPLSGFVAGSSSGRHVHRPSLDWWLALTGSRSVQSCSALRGDRGPRWSATSRDLLRGRRRGQLLASCPSSRRLLGRGSARLRCLAVVDSAWLSEWLRSAPRSRPWQVVACRLASLSAWSWSASVSCSEFLRVSSLWLSAGLWSAPQSLPSAGFWSAVVTVAVWCRYGRLRFLHS